MNPSAPAPLRIESPGRISLSNNTIYRLRRDNRNLRAYVVITNRNTGSTEWLSLQKDRGQTTPDSTAEFETIFEKTSKVYQAADEIVIANASGATITFDVAEFYVDDVNGIQTARGYRQAGEAAAGPPPLQNNPSGIAGTFVRTLGSRL